MTGYLHCSLESPGTWKDGGERWRQNRWTSYKLFHSFDCSIPTQFTYAGQIVFENKCLQILGSELPCHFPTLWSILKAILTIPKVWEPSTWRIGRNAFNVSPGRSGKELVLPGGAVGSWWLRLGKIVVELTGDFTPDVRSSGTREDKGCYRNLISFKHLRLGIHSRYR